MAAPKPTQPTGKAAKPAGKGRAKAKGKADDKPAEKVVSENRQARHDYEILDTLECGIALVGSEVKSLRGGRMSLDEAYGRVDGREVWLLGCDIPEYDKANQLNHVPKRPRKLLMHRREIGKFADRALEKLVKGQAITCVERGRGLRVHPQDDLHVGRHGQGVVIAEGYLFIDVGAELVGVLGIGVCPLDCGVLDDAFADPHQIPSGRQGVLLHARIGPEGPDPNADIAGLNGRGAIRQDKQSCQEHRRQGET